MTNEPVQHADCVVCGHRENGLPGRHLCSLMRPLSDEERKRVELPPEVRAELEAKLDEFDRCRARAAFEARFSWIG
jgi:hypothetical protein